jgi:hypothetical protein
MENRNKLAVGIGNHIYIYKSAAGILGLVPRVYSYQDLGSILPSTTSRPGLGWYSTVCRPPASGRCTKNSRKSPKPIAEKKIFIPEIWEYSSKCHEYTQPNGTEYSIQSLRNIHTVHSIPQKYSAQCGYIHTQVPKAYTAQC